MKKKILMVHNFYQIGGGEHTVFENEINLLRKNGHKVVTYTRSNDELKKSKLKLLLLPLSTVWSFKTYREVKKIIKKENIDIIHCHNTFPLISYSVYYVARSFKIPVVQTIHNFRFLCPAGIFYRDEKVCEDCKEKGSFKYALKNKCYRNSKIQTAVVVAMLKIHRLLGTYKKNSYIFLTEFNREKFSEIIDVNNENTFIKPNFVKKVCVKNTNIKNEIKFIFAGRLEENKGIKFLLNAWENMPSYYKLHIYGDGNLKNYVEENCEKKENVKYLGFKSKKEIFNDLIGAKALIFPSNWYEGYPMIIAESYSIGIPVISSNIGNQKDIVINSRAGELFDFNNIDSFRKCIDNTIKKFDEYSFNAKKYYDKYLNEDYNYKKMEDIYDRVKHIY